MVVFITHYFNNISNAVIGVGESSLNNILTRSNGVYILDIRFLEILELNEIFQTVDPIWIFQ